MEAIAAADRLCLLEFADRPALARERAWLERRYGCACRQGKADAHARLSEQLGEYFAGKRKVFDLPLDYPGTDFQRSVWATLLTAQYGATLSYGSLARAIGRPTAARAVAAAVGQNRLAIVVPCHRIVGSDGSLTGYAGGLERKRRLLELERGSTGPRT